MRDQKLTFKPFVHLVNQFKEEMERRRMVILPRVVRHALLEPAFLVYLLAQIVHPILARMKLVQVCFYLQ